MLTLSFDISRTNDWWLVNFVLKFCLRAAFISSGIQQVQYISCLTSLILVNIYLGATTDRELCFKKTCLDNSTGHPQKRPSFTSTDGLRFITLWNMIVQMVIKIRSQEHFVNLFLGGCACAVLLTHHTIGVGITGLWDRKALDDFWSHPGKSAHHRHVGGVGQELRRPEVTNLNIQTKREREREQNTNWPVCLNWMEKCRYTLVFFVHQKNTGTNLQHCGCCHHHCNKREQRNQSQLRGRKILTYDNQPTKEKLVCYRFVTWGLCEWLWLELLRGGNAALREIKH